MGLNNHKEKRDGSKDSLCKWAPLHKIKLPSFPWINVLKMRMERFNGWIAKRIEMLSIEPVHS